MFGRNNNERMVVLLYNRLRWLNYLYNMIVGGAGYTKKREYSESYYESAMLYHRARKRDRDNDWRNMLVNLQCYSTMTKQHD